MDTMEFVVHALGSGLFCVGLLIRESPIPAIGYGMMAMGLICLTFRLDGE